MTLLAVFRRRVRGYEELVLASDSRLSGGQAMDYGQKVFEMPRSDALFAFAGQTEYAYPLMLQIFRSIEGYPPSVDRRLSLAKLKGHTLRVFQQTYAAIHSLPRGQLHPDPPDNYFVLGGYDWMASDFKAWVLSFDESSRAFIYRKVVGPRGAQFFFAGDDRSAVALAIANTNRLLAKRGKRTDAIDMEPFEVLCEIIRDSRFRSIGGAPQLAKVYAHSNTRLFRVLWPTSSGADMPHVAGRPLLPGEQSSLPAYDPVKGFYSIRDLTAVSVASAELPPH
ncbi:hypothetical protein [Oerskovia turbata]